jgi:PAS domain S-box-containing protein
MAKSNKELLKQNKHLSDENKLLHRQLEEARKSDALIKTKNIDALVIAGKKDLKVFTETSADKTYRLLIEKMHEGAVTLNTKGLIVYCNSHFANLVKVPLQKITGSAFKNYITDFSVRIFEGLLKKAGKNTLGEEFYLRASDDKIIPVLVSLNKLSLNNTVVFSIIVTDLTLQKKNQEELKEKAKQLERINVELGTANKDLVSFTYISSHDLQEPLRKIQTYVSLIKEEEKNLSDTGKGYFERMGHAAKRVQGLIEDLVMYSGSSRSQQFEKVDLQEIVNEVVKDYDKVMKEMNATIRVSDQCELYVVPIQFHQIIDCLISNSLKFSLSHVKPRINITCKIVHGDALKKKNLSPEINYSHITYTDNGRGFDPRYNERIFEVFQRLHRQEEFEGTGMGLAICKRIIENHKGIITASGRLNKGATFDIYIPAA